jgi:hypothetical protein
MQQTEQDQIEPEAAGPEDPGIDEDIDRGE